MEQLRNELDALMATLPNAEAFRSSLETLVSVYPFNEYEYIIATLLAADKLTHDEYVELRDTYIARNLFLYVFEIGALRGFGEAGPRGILRNLFRNLGNPRRNWTRAIPGSTTFCWTTRSRLR